MFENLNDLQIKKSFQKLPRWTGDTIVDTYGNKPILDFNGNPLFAELFALRTFKTKGYDGVWADTYRRTFRTELPEKHEDKISLPDFVQQKLKQINPDGKLSGTWDLILWKDNELKFVELKRLGKDYIRQTQIDFLDRALKNGVPVESFEIFEWIEE